MLSFVLFHDIIKCYCHPFAYFRRICRILFLFYLNNGFLWHWVSNLCCLFFSLYSCVYPNFILYKPLNLHEETTQTTNLHIQKIGFDTIFKILVSGSNEKNYSFISVRWMILLNLYQIIYIYQDDEYIQLCITLYIQ